MLSTKTETSRHRADTVRFDDLILRQSDPCGSAWGLFDEDGAPPDELGRLNLLREEVTCNALLSNRSGQCISLSLSLNKPLVSMNPIRKACVHSITTMGYSRDDGIAFNTQRYWQERERLQFLVRRSKIRPVTTLALLCFLRETIPQPRIALLLEGPLCPATVRCFSHS